MPKENCRNHEITALVQKTLGEEAVLCDEHVVFCEDEWNDERRMAAEEMLAADTTLVKTFWQEKYEKDAAKNWDQFYTRNGTNFYKDRHYLHKVFEELGTKDDLKNKQSVLLEVGCGVGNAALPLLDINPNLHAVCIDFSSVAIDLLKTKPEYMNGRCSGFVCDITKDDVPTMIQQDQGVDYALFFFCLSAIHPDKMKAAVQNIVRSIKPGGKLFFRDYGRYDQAQLRFRPGHKLSSNFYVRQDLTRAYYFTTEEVKEIFESAGLVQEENEYIRRQYANRQQQNVRFRVWIHAKFYKPIVLC